MTKKQDKKIVVGYKGFSKDWKCNGMQYEVGKEFTHKDEVKLCNSGLHFCEDPLDVLNYYELTDSKFAEVEALDVSDEKETDTKRVCKTIRVKAEISIKAMIQASIKFLFEKVDWKTDDVKAASGYFSKLAASGDSSQLAASGHFSQLAASGDSSKLAASGHSSIVAGIGYKNVAKATKGSWIVLAEWIDGKPVCVKAEQIDGKTIKADTFYVLTDGKFQEVK